MQYNKINSIGQLQGNMVSKDFLSPINYSMESYFTPQNINTIQNNVIEFENILIKAINDNILFFANGNYYMDIQLNYLSKPMEGYNPNQCLFKFWLCSNPNINDVNTEKQLIKTYSIPVSSNATTPIHLRLYIKPKNNYKYLLLSLEHPAEEIMAYKINDLENSVIKKSSLSSIQSFNVKNLNIQQVNNLLPINDITILTKIGVEGKPGLMMVINREFVQIGNSGIFEIPCDFSIDFLGFVIDKKDLDYNALKSFLVNYTYEMR